MELKKLHECSLPMQAGAKEPAGFPIAEAAHPGAPSDRAQLIFCL